MMGYKKFLFAPFLALMLFGLFTGNVIPASAQTTLPLIDQETTNQISTLDVEAQSVAADHFLFKFGSFGTADGQFSGPFYVAVDSNDRIIVTDNGNHRVQIFDSAGNHIQSFGTPGTADGQFTLPYGVAVDSNDRIIVADLSNDRVQIFDSSGNFVMMFGFGVSDGSAVFQKCTSTCQVGIAGSGIGQFNQPIDVAVDSTNRIIVVENGNHRIQIFDSTGTHIQSFGSSGTANGQFNGPTGVAVDSNDRIIVADFNNDRVQIFDSAGTFITRFGSSGSGDGQFNGPAGVTVDNNNRIFVSEFNGHRVQIFDSAGSHLDTFGSGPGSADGEFNSPIGIAVDSTNRIIVVDPNNHRVQVFSHPLPGGFASTTGNVIIQGRTCGIQINSGAPINYGILTPNAVSAEQPLLVQNTGTVTGTLFVSGQNWVDAVPSTVITVDHTAFASSASVVFSSKSSLSTTPTQIAGVSFNPATPISTFWQLEAILSNTNFVGSLSQEMTFTASC